MYTAALDALQFELDPRAQLGLAAALFTIMLSVALGLRVQDFKRVASRPLVYGAGVASQVIGLPLLTVALLFLLDPPASVALGMIVVAACPGGNVSNLMTHAARGDAALSVSLTATSSAFAAMFTPTSILLWSRTYPPTADLLRSIDFDPVAFLAQTTALLALPLAIGMTLATKKPTVAGQLRPIAGWAGALALLAIVVIGVIQFAPQLISTPGAMAAISGPVLIHNAAAFTLGYGVARLIRADKSVRRTFTFEIGLQNSGLALVILVAQLNGLGGAAAVAAAWGVWHLISGGVMIVAFRLSDKRKRPQRVTMLGKD
ncbi:MAG: bile acid:sodium symporter [Pseudomonadota bacterium]